ncbi:hypothetical protein [Hydrogenimonas sp.]
MDRREDGESVLTTKLETVVPRLAGKKVLFLGKSKTMSDEDIALFLDQAGAELAEGEEDSPLGLVVLGRLLNPLEEAFGDQKAREGVAVVTLEEVERHYAATIDPEALLGSLALFANRERIINLLHNSAIGDDLFCEILRFYDWQGEGPFENDENRDVAGMLVARFYPDIKKNHNIQYSPVGPFLVAAQCGYPALLEAMAEIPDYEVSQRSGDPWMPRSLHESLLVNPALPASVLRRFAQSGDLRKEGFVAAHPNLPAEEQQRAARRTERWIHEGLARNPNLCSTLHAQMVASGEPTVRSAFLEHQRLSEGVIDTVLHRGDERELEALGANGRLEEATALKLARREEEALLRALAKNETLSHAVYEALEAGKVPDVLRALAGNPAVEPALLERLTRVRDRELYKALAANPSMPETHLRNFAKIRDRQIHMALAANPSTPIEILLGYQTDGELNRILKRNEAFGAYIRQNLGM